jgi:hypothetical protein
MLSTSLNNDFLLTLVTDLRTVFLLGCSALHPRRFFNSETGPFQLECIFPDHEKALSNQISRHLSA